MLRIFNAENNRIEEPTNIQPGCWVALTAPDEDELSRVAAVTGIELNALKAALDEEERSRLEIEDEYSMIIVDIPITEERNDKQWYGTIPLGIITTENYIVTVCLDDTSILTAFMNGRIKGFYTSWKTRFIFQILYRNAEQFLQYLRAIDKKSEIVEKNLHSSQQNRELMQMLELEKSLVYFTTSLKSNEMVLDRMLKSKNFKKYPEDTDLLEDVIVENKQAIEMANIYSGILSDTMDAYSSVISNNLNVVMKVLAVITLVLSIPTMVFSAYGMNLNPNGMPFSFTPWGFLIVIGLSVIISIIFAIFFAKSKIFKS